MQEFINDSLGFFILIVLVIMIVFLVTREFWCWYYKINSRAYTLESIDKNLEEIKLLMLQGNTLNGVITNEMSNISSHISSNKDIEESIKNDDLPEL